MTATHYKADGTTAPAVPAGKVFTLDELQTLVGGYIEIHELTDGRLMVANEDGYSLRLPVNEAATVEAFHLATGGNSRKGNPKLSHRGRGSAARKR